MYRIAGEPERSPINFTVKPLKIWSLLLFLFQVNVRIVIKIIAFTRLKSTSNSTKIISTQMKMLTKPLKKMKLKWKKCWDKWIGKSWNDDKEMKIWTTTKPKTVSNFVENKKVSRILNNSAFTFPIFDFNWSTFRMQTKNTTTTKAYTNQPLVTE